MGARQAAGNSWTGRWGRDSGADRTFLQLVCLSNTLEDKTSSFHPCNSGFYDRISLFSLSLKSTTCLTLSFASQASAPAGWWLGSAFPRACHWALGPGWETLSRTKSAITSYFCFSLFCPQEGRDVDTVWLCSVLPVRFQTKLCSLVKKMLTVWLHSQPNQEELGMWVWLPSGSPFSPMTLMHLCV